jgi:hypothetical protein
VSGCGRWYADILSLEVLDSATSLLIITVVICGNHLDSLNVAVMEHSSRDAIPGKDFEIVLVQHCVQNPFWAHTVSCQMTIFFSETKMAEA